jgi:hypothetical protein
VVKLFPVTAHSFDFAACHAGSYANNGHQPGSETAMINRAHTLIKISSIVGLSLAMLASAKPASAQTTFPLLSVMDTGIAAPSSPACVASADGTGYLICVHGDGNNNLSATTMLAANGGFNGFGLLENNPLSLGVAGKLGPASCASTAAGTGDVVCAYTSTAGATNGQLMGVRFNTFNKTIYPTQSLGLSIVGNPACTNGIQLGNLLTPPTPTQVNGPTICLVRNSGTNLLTAIAFNPFSGSFARINSGEVATADSSCANANPNANGNTTDLTERVICVYNNNGTMRSIAFNTNPFASGSAELNLGSGFPATVTPSCSAPNDGSGDVFCAYIDNASLWSFAVNPVTGNTSGASVLFGNLPLEPGGSGVTGLTGTPSCSGATDGLFELVCGFLVSECLANSCGTNEFPTQLWSYGAKFDVRGIQVLNIWQGAKANANPSCAWVYQNPAGIACAMPGPGGTLLGKVFTPAPPR